MAGRIKLVALSNSAIFFFVSTLSSKLVIFTNKVVYVRVLEIFDLFRLAKRVLI